MTITFPYHRTYRPNIDDQSNDVGNYIDHPAFAKSPEHYIRAFLLLQKDLKTLFDYIEPADQNLQCYSFRTHELLVRASVEVEANFKAILSENGYSAPGNWNISTFFKVDASHRLSEYEIKVPVWSGDHAIRKPFKCWTGLSKWEPNKAPQWYSAYNDAKHDRHNEFSKATFENMIDAFAACLVILSSQFHTMDFVPGPILLSAGSSVSDGMESGIGDFFRVKFPSSWTLVEKYPVFSEDNPNLKGVKDPFLKYPYQR